MTLVELLITIAITGVAITAIVWGMITSITVSGLHRKQATADTMVRDAAEAVINVQQQYKISGTYDLSSVPVPSGYSVSITDVRFCTLPPLPVTTFTSDCSSSSDTGTGLQLITITAKSSDGQAVETVQVMKRKVG